MASSGGLLAIAVVNLVVGGFGCGFYGYEDRSEVVCAGSCPDAAPFVPIDCSDGSCHRVFLTSEAPASGSLGGVAGADAFCQARADLFGLGGSYRAWLSDLTSSPSTRFTQASVPYRLLDGTIVADDWADLTDGSLDHAIDVHEDGSRLAPGEVREVWTGTDTSGAAKQPTCADWTDGKGWSHGFVGAAGPSSDWTSARARSCDAFDVSLYCFEQ